MQAEKQVYRGQPLSQQFEHMFRRGASTDRAFNISISRGSAGVSSDGRPVVSPIEIERASMAARNFMMSLVVMWYQVMD